MTKFHHFVQCAVPLPARWRRHTEANMKNNKEKKDHRNTNHTQKEAKTQSLPVNALSRFLTSHAVNRGFDRPSCKRQVPTQTLTVLRYFRVVLSLLKFPSSLSTGTLLSGFVQDAPSVAISVISVDVRILSKENRSFKRRSGQSGLAALAFSWCGTLFLRCLDFECCSG